MLHCYSIVSDHIICKEVWYRLYRQYISLVNILTISGSLVASATIFSEQWRAESYTNILSL